MTFLWPWMQHYFLLLKLLITASTTSMLTVNELYSMATHKDQGGIEGYDFEKKYFDPIKEAQKR